MYYCHWCDSNIEVISLSSCQSMMLPKLDEYSTGGIICLVQNCSMEIGLSQVKYDPIITFSVNKAKLSYCFKIQ